MKKAVTLDLITENDVFDAVDVAMEMAGNTGFDRLQCQLVATAVSEIATNAIRYAGKGRIDIGKTANSKGLSVVVTDKGPGIRDPKKAMKDGVTTTKTSLGLGMGAACRAMDYFDIRTKPGFGTRIRMEKYLPIPPGDIDYGIASLPDEHYNINGDAYVIKEFGGDKVLLAVIDGLGEGKSAYQSAALAKSIIEDSPHEPLDLLLQRCHEAFKEKGRHFGASIGLLLVKPGSFSYAAVGDTFLKILTGRRQQPISQRGIVGQFRMPTIKVLKRTGPSNNLVFALCTDGIKDHFTGADLPLDLAPPDLAAHILSRYRREFGDATVLITRIHRS